MRAAIYARVSSEEQVQNFSIENQIDQLRRYCRQRNYEVVGEYVDPGFSGTTLDRPALLKLLEAAKSKLFEVVLVYKLDRLFRSNRHMYNTLADWEELGISLVSITEPFDTTTTMGKAYLGMASTFAEWERNTFIERSRDGLRKAIEKGFYSGGIVAYGYRLNPDTKRLEIDEQEAEVVRNIFHWLIEEGISCYTIAQRLNAFGIPTRYARDERGVKGKTTASIWRPGRVYNMLRNTMYKGKWIYGKRGKKKQLIEADCPAIIEGSTFEQAQARLKENNLWADRNHRRQYLLQGLIKCDLCGHSYTGYYSHSTSNGELRYYRCNRNGNRGNLLSERCDAPTIRADLVEDLIWQQISEFIQKPEVIKRALENKFDACRQATCIAEIAQARHRLDELKEAERRLLRLYADPSRNYSKEALDGALTDIARDKRLVQKRVHDLEEAMAGEDEQRRKLADVQAILVTLKERVRNVTFEVKQQVVRNLVSEIRVGKSDDCTPTLKIVYAFSEDWLDKPEAVQLHSARMPLRLLRRPLQGMQVLLGRGFPLSQEAQRTAARPH